MTVHESDSRLDTSEDQRWQEILAGFVDDPRGSVQAAIELAEGDVSAFLQVLSERKESMLSTPVNEQDTQTEDMRKTIIAYRAFSRHLAESKPSLS